MRGKLLIAITILLVLNQRASGRTLSSSLAPAPEDVEFILPVALTDSVQEIPPPKCFTEEATRSAESASCLTLPPGSTSRSNESGNTTNPNAPQSRASITCGKDTTIPVEKLGSCPDTQMTLDAHNAARARWGAPPLLWSNTLADYAQAVSNTCVFQHSRGPYGENLAIGGGLSCKAAVDLWVAEQSQWPPGGTPGFSSATGHFSAVVWKSTTQVGCATRSCSGRNFVTCSYNPPGNVIGSFDTQVGCLGQTPECVATTTPTVPSTTSPPPPTAPRTPPPPAPPLGRCCYFYICFRC